VALRALTLDDAPALQALYEACADFSLQLSGLPPAPNAACQDLQEPDPVTERLGCWRGPELLGMVEYRRNHPHDGVLFIGVLQLAPAWRHQGVGTQTMDLLIAQWRAQGMHELRLCVLASSLSAQRFWQRLGFACVRTLPPVRFGRLSPVRQEWRRPL